MARIRKINVSEVEGRNPFDNNTSILQDGTLTLYNDNGTWKLRAHDGVTNGGKSLTETGNIVFDADIISSTSENIIIQGSISIQGTGSLNDENLLSSNTIQRIETITSASYASLDLPVSGTLYLVID